MKDTTVGEKTRKITGSQIGRKGQRNDGVGVRKE